MADPNLTVLDPNSGEVKLNMKLLSEVASLTLFGTLLQPLIDNQIDSRRRAANSGSTDLLTLTNAITSGQTGQTAETQTVSPIRTGTGDYLASGAVPANRATDVAAAGVATANQGIADALANAVALFNQGIAALQAVVVTAAGGASTPSQTQPKPAA